MIFMSVGFSYLVFVSSSIKEAFDISISLIASFTSSFSTTSAKRRRAYRHITETLHWNNKQRGQHAESTPFVCECVPITHSNILFQVQRSEIIQMHSSHSFFVPSQWEFTERTKTLNRTKRKIKLIIEPFPLSLSQNCTLVSTICLTFPFVYSNLLVQCELSITCITRLEIFWLVSVQDHHLGLAF